MNVTVGAVKRDKDVGRHLRLLHSIGLDENDGSQVYVAASAPPNVSNDLGRIPT